MKIIPVLKFYPQTISLYVFFILALISVHAGSQPVQYRFQHFNSENGLSQNTVYDICQDQYGFMWFSTRNGVCRFDGYSTKVFRPSDFFDYDVVDLSQCIGQSGTDQMVFATGSGLCFINMNSEVITKRIDFSKLDTNNIHINNIFSMCVDGIYIWLGTGNGLLRYNQNTGKTNVFTGKDLIPGFKSSRCWVKSLTKDPSGFVWLATQEGLVKLNTTTFKTEVYNSGQDGKRNISNDYFSSVAFDKQGRLWAGTLRKGVFCMNLKDSVFTNVNFTGLTDTSESFNEVKRLLCDSKGMIWAGTQYTGLVKIDPTDYSIQKIRSGIVSQHNLPSDLISALYEAQNELLWVGTYNSGVDRTTISGSSFTHIPFASVDSTCFQIKAVECFAQHDSSQIWVGTMKGLFLFNRQTNTCRTFEEVTGNKIQLPHSSVAGVIRTDDDLWIGTRSNVLLRVNLINNSFTLYQPDTTDPIQKTALDFRSLVKTPSGELYFSFDTRIFIYDKQNDNLKTVLDRDSALLGVTRIWKLFTDDENKIFLSSDIAGLHVYDPGTSTLTRIKSPDEEKDRFSQNATVSQNPNGGYAITTYKGLYEMDRNYTITSFYNSKNGLSENKICNTETDKSGRIWMATYNGLSMFNPQNKLFHNFYFHDGLIENEFREAKSMQSADGTIYFPSGKGFTYFKPEQVLSQNKNGKVFLTGIRIFGKDQIFVSNLNSLEKIFIPSGNNIFSILFSSTSFNTSQPSSYLYKLEGFDNDWVTAGASNSANYTNLDGGDYIFKVKLANSTSEEKSIGITVGTVFFKTWWFRGFLFLVFLALVYNFIKFRDAQINKKESIKIVDYFANSFYGKNSVEEILWDVCRNCISRLGFEDAVVYMLEEDRMVLVQKAAYGPKNPKDFEIENPLEIPVGTGIVGTVAQTGKAEIVYDTSRDPRYIADDEKRLSEIAVPIIYRGKVIGVIDSENSRKRFFNSEHLRILSTIASICSTKIAKAQSDLAAQERERKLLEIGKKVAETRLMALRAQMNPHFIFNSLNAIQECIVNSKIEEAHIYLSRFSRLLRMVIDYSEKSLISLDKEIEFLNLYLGLESLRFGQSFQYNISVDPGLDEEETLLPSLLIQPLVENAIWHGLLHKNGDRKLMISFSHFKKDHLLCVVHDNGIGRKKAAEIKAGKFDSQKHESKGMQISQERIDLVKLQTESNTDILVEDLFDSSGQPAGTKVSVILPLDIS